MISLAMANQEAERCLLIVRWTSTLTGRIMAQILLGMRRVLVEVGSVLWLKFILLVLYLYVDGDCV